MRTFCPVRLNEDIPITTSTGGTRIQTWSYPSRGQCLQCHNTFASYVLGVKTHQMNGNFTYPSTGRTDNQLRTFAHVGLLNPTPNEADIPTFLKSVSISNTSVPVQDRMRSWIDSNCSQCHRPGGFGPAFDARFYVPLEDQGLVDNVSSSAISRDRRFMTATTPWMTGKCHLWPRTWSTKPPWLICVNGSQARWRCFQSISTRIQAIS